MRIEQALVALTVVNFGLLVFLLAQTRPVEAQGAVAPLLRAREFEIVDDHGKVRASLKVQPAGQTPNGAPYSESVILRLIDSKGQPSVKLSTSEQGGGLALVGDADASYIVLNAEGPVSSLKLTNKDGRQQMIQP